ncbi:hypothetical protein H6G20_07715 [Desertifilum sp. FACHB-1129]|uniref:Uncharacterized protein n=2 Tax=Desertifilum tharense IPPAS B-1220 TaxID=1781255 RepID=A0A1E5QIR1_9CYAN|nr:MULTISPECIES: hypothetical protein [Desertifilum]MDA0210543.1 hypothetical protein [Cyanobacteria bacterium FC1]MBD2311543.1 hypothetical protein [Desertifilum sp. FACHB-1129]MBD2323117.1 hypothetical protein [Desertifilum sp. FACHB-866]MBD2332962.1 hypothetical protein [Desertifilum sp. FACHB-868]OEJ74569.1 hypothetical protein BH720_13925 [Desertifilum tharense IPPAS B-1220]
MSNNREPQSQEDIRSKTTKTIWSYATGMIALSVIFASGMRYSVLLPISIAAGAAGGTAAVWLSDKKQLDKAESLRQLEDRIANLETIAGTSDFSLEQRIRQLESRDRPL